jgi:hypothetical protein
MGCGPSRPVEPAGPYEDDGNTEWLDDLDSFMSNVFAEGDRYGLSTDAAIEMAGRGLLDCPFDNEWERELWYKFRDDVYRRHQKVVDTTGKCPASPSHRKSPTFEDADFTGASEIVAAAEMNEESVNTDIVREVAANILYQSPYLIMRSEQYCKRVDFVPNGQGLVVKASFHRSFSSVPVVDDDEDENGGFELKPPPKKRAKDASAEIAETKENSDEEDYGTAELVGDDAELGLE